MNWAVYIILCSDDSLYTGITTDVTRRFNQHLNQKGAKYFRSHQPKELVFIEEGHTRRSASQKEIAIKNMTRKQKLSLITEKS